MGALKINENLYAVGVINPALRIFDVIMTTEYGTSYNAYLIKNDGKAALIETVHYRFFDEYLENIKSVLGESAPDYLIMNHNEPDHSGSVAKLTEVYPEITIIESKAGAIYLKNIANKELKVKTVTDNETLDFGGDELKFIIAPFLHWPDSMFTYFKKAGALFTCDFLGSHFCEPNFYDNKIKYPAAYEKSFLGYYTAIFSPFKPYVLQGLEKMKDIEADLVCSSHGPILTKGCGIEEAVKKYAKWSETHKNETKQIPVFYCSAYSNTKFLAEKIAEGVRTSIPDASAVIYDINEHPMSELTAVLHGSDAFLLGSPTINRDAVAPVWNLINTIDAISMKDRPCAVFGSYGWSGEGCPNIISRLKGLKMKVNETPYRVQFIPSEAELSAAFDFGKEFAESL